MKGREDGLKPARTYWETFQIINLHGLARFAKHIVEERTKVMTAHLHTALTKRVSITLGLDGTRALAPYLLAVVTHRVRQVDYQVQQEPV